MRPFHGALAIWLVLPALLGACTANDVVDPFDTPKRVWPEPPQTARVVYVGEFSTAADLGIKESFWSRIVAITAGPSSRAMVRPMAVAVTDDGQIIYVADSEAHCVHRFDLKKRRYTKLEVARDLAEAFPIGLAITDDNWLFVTDSQRGLLYRVAPGGGELEVFDTAAVVRQPTGIFWDSGADQLFVTDTISQVVLVIDREGDLKHTIGERGAGPGQLNFPTYLWMDGHGELLISDSLNFRVQRFDNKGSFLYQFGENGDEPGYFSRPKGIATDSLGHIYVVDSLLHALQIFGQRGEFLLSIGQQGQGSGEFWLPNGIFITKDNTIFMADSYNARIQVFRYVGPEA